jgi:hypothetical protein
VDNTDRGNRPDHADGDPCPAAVTFVTTEHFTLQGARSSTISESTSRASVFLGAVSGGLIALGLVATAAKTGVAFYAFGLILLPTLAFVGLATFHRVRRQGSRTLPTRAVSLGLDHDHDALLPSGIRRTGPRPSTTPTATDSPIPETQPNRDPLPCSSDSGRHSVTRTRPGGTRSSPVNSATPARSRSLACCGRA